MKKFDITVYENTSVGEFYDIYLDGKSVCKKENLKTILDNGSCAEIHDNEVNMHDENLEQEIGKIITGILNGDYVKVEG
jgi:hypothetical protein